LQIAASEARLNHVEREVRVPQPADEVWRAIADPARLGEWLGGDVDFEARPGARGSFRSTGGAVRRVVVLAVEDGHELSFRWWPDADVGAGSTVTITVERRGDREATVRVRETRAQALRATA
jgi:uncharacterized protein YndB with AHSA1/START domain